MLRQGYTHRFERGADSFEKVGEILRRERADRADAKAVDAGEFARVDEQVAVGRAGGRIRRNRTADRSGCERR